MSLILIHSIRITYIQQVKSKGMMFSALQVDLPDAPGTMLGDLSTQNFTVYWDHFSLHDAIHEFHGVIGQERQLVNVGDFVFLSPAQHEVILISKITMYVGTLLVILHVHF